MKKAVTINLSGFIFHIDEDAFETLSNYLKNIAQRFPDMTENKEILSDIENRIAELFTERLQGRQVLSLEDVEYIIEVIGKPEIFDETENMDNVLRNNRQQTNYRRMYRHPDDRILGGICGGIAAYFDINSVFIRILFTAILILSAGSVIIAYLILWFIIPEAKTRAQKLEMKGQRVNLENLEKTVKHELNIVKENIRNLHIQEKLKRLGFFLEKAFRSLLNTLNITFRSMGIFFGIILLLTGFILLLIITASFWTNKWYISASSYFTSSYSLPGLLETITSSSIAIFTAIGIVLVAGIPMVWLIFTGIKFVFRIRSHGRIFNMLTSFLFVAGILIIIISGLVIGQNFKAESRKVIKEVFPQVTGDTLFIHLSKDSIMSGFYFIKTNELKIFRSKTDNHLLICPYYKIKKGNNQVVIVQKEIFSRGANQIDAERNLDNILFNISAKKDSICFAPYFTINENTKYRGQWLENTILIPVGKYVFIDENMKNHISDYDGIKNIFPENFFNKYLKMTSNGLVLPD